MITPNPLILRTMSQGKPNYVVQGGFMSNDQVVLRDNRLIFGFFTGVDADDERTKAVNEGIALNLHNLERFSEALGKIRTDELELYDYPDLATDFYGAWQDSSAVVTNHLGVDQVVELFEAVLPLYFWDGGAVETLWELSDPLVIYRGGAADPDALKSGLSWTLHRAIAEAYAAKFPDGHVVSAEVLKTDVLWFDELEGEVVVRPGTPRFPQP